jgi:hypothetical protein
MGNTAVAWAAPERRERALAGDGPCGPTQEVREGLCDRYGISRYELVHRVEAEGAEGLEDRSRAPHSCPHRTPSEIEELVLAAKQAHPSWGTRKLLGWLHRRHPRRTLPARSTVADLLARSGWYNEQRPHEALDDDTPASRWRPSPRPYPEQIAKPAYPGHFLVRPVSKSGCFRWHARQIFVSQALASA